jgi:uncharacterized protein YdiU (UPF0061 family)
MRQVNPFFIPRNYLVEEVIEKNMSGDSDILQSFLEIYKSPYEYTQIDISLRTFPT